MNRLKEVINEKEIKQNRLTEKQGKSLKIVIDYAGARQPVGYIVQNCGNFASEQKGFVGGLIRIKNK
jgi:hypothetical protein